RARRLSRAPWWPPRRRPRPEHPDRRVEEEAGDHRGDDDRQDGIRQCLPGGRVAAKYEEGDEHSRRAGGAGHGGGLNRVDAAREDMSAAGDVDDREQSRAQRAGDAERRGGAREPDREHDPNYAEREQRAAVAPDALAVEESGGDRDEQRIDIEEEGHEPR